jgi:hypothetical protein
VDPFRSQVEDRIDLDELYSVGIVHVQSISELASNIPVFGSLHPPVRFIHDENVDILQIARLRLDNSFSSRSDLALSSREPFEIVGVRQSGSNQLEAQVSFNVPQADPENRSNTLHGGAVRLKVRFARIVANKRSRQKVIQAGGQ